MGLIPKSAPIDFARRKVNWLKPTGSDSNIVLTTLVRFSRNLAGFNFTPRANPEQLKVIYQRVKKAVEENNYWSQAELYEIRSLSEESRFVLLERRIIGRELVECKTVGPAVGIFRSGNESFTINEEDHLRIQVITSGSEATSAWQKARKYLSSIGERLEFAHHNKYGWLTCSPAEAGTGLKVTLFCHLPALSVTDKLEETFDIIYPAGILIRGIFDDNQHYLGDLFQISNQATLGITEEEIINKMGLMVREIVKAERSAREKLKEDEDLVAKDRVSRAYAILTQAKLLGVKEFIGFVSFFRLGLDLGWIKGISPYSINKLVLKALPGHISAKYKKSPPQIEQDRMRAELVKRELAKTELKLN